MKLKYFETDWEEFLFKTSTFELFFTYKDYYKPENHGWKYHYDRHSYNNYDSHHLYFLGGYWSATTKTKSI